MAEPLSSNADAVEAGRNGPQQSQQPRVVQQAQEDRYSEQLQESGQPQQSQLPGQPLQALVFGASGITGYALMGSLLTYPTPTTFTRVIGLTNRPLSREVSQLPSDQRIEIYSGMDLLSREQSLRQIAAIPGIKHTTHVYFAAYTGHGSSYEDLRKVNDEILVNAVGAVEICCPDLRFFTLQTGGKAYGVEFHDQVPYNPPLRESLPRIPEPLAQNIFYYSQHDILRRASAGKAWQFAEIRPDAIVGFVPQNNAMNIGQALGLFLSLWKEIEVRGGAPAAVPFPGSGEAWTALHTDTSQDILARFHIHVSMVAEGGEEGRRAVSGRAFNVADGRATTWEHVWPRICGYFGLHGLPPSEKDAEGFSAQRWMEEHRGTWEEWVARNGLKEGALEGTSWDFMQAILSIPFRRDYDLSRSREIGFIEERAPEEGYFRTFEEMRKAKLIP